MDETEPSADLFHYTNPHALHQIIEHGLIHATDCRFLNDSKEVKYALEEVAIPTLLALEKQHPADANGMPGYSALADRLSRWVGTPVSPSSVTIGDATNTQFVASFSREPDQLGQWRGYGARTRGYAIGLVGTRLAEVATHTTEIGNDAGPPQPYVRPAQLMEVIYNRAEQQRRFSGLLEGRVNPPTPSGFAFFQRDLLEMAIQCKHPSFEEEHEVRLVIDGHVGPGAGPAVTPSFRSDGRYVVPFLRLDITDAHNRIPLGVVICGPSDNPELAQLGVKSLLARNGYEGIPVVSSQIPYRG